jgi:serine/threonine protein kinase
MSLFGMQENILINDALQPVLADFGLATEAFNMVTTASQNFNGSLRWLAPEVIQGQSQKTLRSDIYAFGLTILQVLPPLLPLTILLSWVCTYSIDAKDFYRQTSIP